MSTSAQQNTEVIAALVRAAEVQANAGQLPAALSLFEQAIALDPKNAAVLDGAARISLQMGKLNEAMEFARRAVQVLSAVPYVLTLAEILRTGGKFDLAQQYYEAIHQQMPDHVPALVGLAETYEQTGYRSLALESCEKIVRLGAAEKSILRKFGKLVAYEQSERVFAAYEQGRPPSTAPFLHRIDIDLPRVHWKEYAERVKRGLPANARSREDMNFCYAAADRDDLEATVDAELAANPQNGYATVIKGHCLLSRGKRREAQKYYKAYAEALPQSLFANVNFQDEFFHSLEQQSDDDLISGLPPLLHIVTPDFVDAPIIFFSCDSRYYLQFTRPMLLSINDVAQKSNIGPIQVHVHIMDATDEELSEAVSFVKNLSHAKVALSAERPDVRKQGESVARCYFHAIRFVRMYQMLKIYAKPLWLMDVDGLMHLDPRPLFNDMNGADVALFGHPARWEPWMYFNASMMGIQPTAKAEAFLRLIAGYIRHYHKRGELNWGIDQLAMFAAFEFMTDDSRPLAVKMLPVGVVDSSCKDSSIVWNNGGPGKFMPPKLSGKAASVHPDSPRIRYTDALKKYTDQL